MLSCYSFGSLMPKKSAPGRVAARGAPSRFSDSQRLVSKPALLALGLLSTPFSLTRVALGALCLAAGYDGQSGRRGSGRSDDKTGHPSEHPQWTTYAR
jgi:hypothetical protein